MSTESTKPLYTKIKVTTGVVANNLTKAVIGEVIATGDKNVIVRTSTGLEEVTLVKKSNDYRVKDRVIFSEHGVLTEHLRPTEPKEKTVTPARSGSMRCPSIN